MLDGAGYNTPIMDDEDGPDIPDKPDIRTEPVEFLRWQFLHAPGVPAHIRKSPEEVEVLCQRFAGEIERGEKVWDEEAMDWVKI